MLAARTLITARPLARTIARPFHSSPLAAVKLNGKFRKRPRILS